MITVNISINGEPVYTRTAVNRLQEHGVYILDTGERIHHNPEDGAIALAVKMLHSIYENPDNLTLCDNCYMMTETWHDTCKKCRAVKGNK
jgi:hypothetical protein